MTDIQGDPLLSQSDLSFFFGVTVRTIQNWVRDARAAAAGPDRSHLPRWRRSEILDHVDKLTHPQQ